MADERPEHKITAYDIQLMASNAVRNYVNCVLPMKVSKRTLDEREPAHVAMIEAVVMYLNGKGLLNANVKIDYDPRK